MRSRLAIIASGIPSPLTSALEFANQARAAGYEVHILAPAASASMILHAGFRHYVIPNPKINAFQPLLPPAREPDTDVNDRLDAAISSLGVDVLANTLSEVKPDAVFVDCELHAHIIVALSLDYPVIQYSNMFLSRPGFRAPPLHRRVIPGRGLRGSKIGVLLVWMHYLLGKASKVLRNRVADRGADYPRALLKLASRYRVPILKLLRLVTWQMPWTYRIPIVLFLPEALDLPTRPYSNQTYLGPMILRDRRERDHNRETVEQFCEAQSGRKRIYVAFGTIMQPESALVRRIWEVARRHPEWQFLYAAGKDWSDTAAISVLENVHVVPWVPQHRVLHDVDLAIMHGGTGGLIEAVAAATPMLLYPHINDQHGSAARAEFHGIGRMGDRKDPIEKIEVDIADLLGNPDIRVNCIRMQKACNEEIDREILGQYLTKLVSENSDLK